MAESTGVTADHANEGSTLAARVARAEKRSTIGLILGSVSVACIALMAIKAAIGPVQIVVGNRTYGAAVQPVAAAAPSLPAYVAEPSAATPAAAPAAVPDAVAVPSADDISVITYENQPYAYDRRAQIFYTFDAKMNAQPARVESLPPQVVTMLSTGQAPAAAVGNSDELYAQAQRVTESIANGDELRAINALFGQKEVAEKALATFEKAAGIAADGTPGMEHPVYVFFDPRCPYCHKLFTDMASRNVDAKWLPTLSLGEAGAPLLAYIMGDSVTMTKDANGISIPHVAPDANTAMTARLREVMTGGAKPTSGQPTDAVTAIVADNANMMRFLYVKNEHLLGVPTIVVARPDGTARVLRGYEPNTVSQILDLQGGK